jgi:hypothetical protein
MLTEEFEKFLVRICECRENDTGNSILGDSISSPFREILCLLFGEEIHFSGTSTKI